MFAMKIASKIRLSIIPRSRAALHFPALQFSRVVQPEPTKYGAGQEEQLDDSCILVDEKDKVIGSASKLLCHKSRPDGTYPFRERACLATRGHDRRRGDDGTHVAQWPCGSRASSIAVRTSLTAWTNARDAASCA